MMTEIRRIVAERRQVKRGRPAKENADKVSIKSDGKSDAVPKYAREKR